MEIITAARKDAPIVHSVALSTIKSVYPRYYPAGAVKTFLNIHSAQNIADSFENERVLLLFVEGKPVATASSRQNRIKRVFVLEEYQGRGLGGALMDALEEPLLTQYGETLLDASLPGYGFYLGRGYAPIEYHVKPAGDGCFICYNVMLKRRRIQHNP